MTRAPHVAAVLILLLPIVPPLRAQPPVYAVAPLRSDWDDAHTVGRRGSGAFCVPSGTIAWKQVAPDPVRGAARIAQTLRAAGMDVLVGDEDDAPPSARYRIVARIVDLKLTVCAPHFGIVRVLGGTTIRGDGHLRMSWRVRDTGTRTDGPIQTLESEFTFDRSDRTLAEGLMMGLDTNAKRFAATMSAPAK